MVLIQRDWREYLSSGGYLALPLVAFEIGDALAWAACLGAVFVISIVTWLINLRRLRAIADTPTSRVASAAQGYVELVGIGRALPYNPTLSPTHHLPCLWYRYRRFEKCNDKWVETVSDESEADFYLEDGEERCLLHPGETEILSSRKETYRQANYKVVEELLLAGDRLYALGDFVTLRETDALTDQQARIGDLLSDWKTDQAELKRRFDLDHDGRIDDQEWHLARQAARREVEKENEVAQHLPVTHALRLPRDGRPHLIANFPPEQIASRYRWRTGLHAAVMLASLIGLALVLQSLSR